MGMFNWGSKESNESSTLNTEFKTSGNAPAVYGSHNLVTVNNTSDRALDSVDRAVTGSFQFGSRALDSVDRAVFNSLAASTAATSASISASSNAAKMALDANGSVSRDAMSLSDRAVQNIANSFYDALGYTSHITDLALAQNQDVARSAMSQVAQGYESAKSLGVNAGTVDNKYLIAVGMVVVGVFAVKAWGK